ncbi:MAG: TauD/TfdA family dioxygenase [Gammaproteobacteria bacterium]|nr:TauD/TfdA family dioxygenase [Gammaproteobacteria bacterium]
MPEVTEINVLPSGSACGAEVRGVDISRPLSEPTFAQVRGAFFEHGMLVFRDQSISERQQIDFTARFGEPDQYVLSEYQAQGYPEILLISNLQREGKNIGLADAGTTWHTDSSYLPTPPLATLLYAREVPMQNGRVLGDTIFTSAAAAYDALTDATKATIEGLTATHWYHGKHQARAKLGRSDRNAPKPSEAEKLAPVDHPIVRTHPVTGRKALYVAQGECIGIAGWDEDKALALIDELAEHTVSTAFHYRHRWQAGDLVIWDNCQLQHLAIKDYALPLRRLMHRTQVKGTAPF